MNKEIWRCICLSFLALLIRIMTFALVHWLLLSRLSSNLWFWSRVLSKYKGDWSVVQVDLLNEAERISFWCEDSYLFFMVRTEKESLESNFAIYRLFWQDLDARKRIKTAFLAGEGGFFDVPTSILQKSATWLCCQIAWKRPEWKEGIRNQGSKNDRGSPKGKA